MFFSELLTFAERLEKQGKIQLAAELYQKIGQEVENGRNDPEIRRRAQERLGALAGSGIFGARFECLLERSLGETLRPDLLLAMAGGRAAFGLTRWASASLGRDFFSTAFRLKAAGHISAFLAETAAFTGVQRSAANLFGGSPVVSGDLISNWGAGAAMLFGLRILGGSGQAAARVWARGKTPIAANTLSLISHAAIPGGIYVGALLGESLGFRESNGNGIRLSDTLAIWMQAGISNRVLHQLTPTPLQNLGQRLSLQAESLELIPRFQWNFKSLNQPSQVKEAGSRVSNSIAPLLGASLGLASFLKSGMAHGQNHPSHGVGEMVVSQASFGGLEVFGLGVAVLMARQGYLRGKAAHLGKKAAQDDKALQSLYQMAQIGNRPYAFRAIGQAAVENPNAIFVLWKLSQGFGNKRVIFPILLNLKTESLAELAARDLVSLDALTLLSTIGNEAAQSAVNQVNLLHFESQAQRDLSLALKFLDLASVHGNASAKAFFDRMDKKALMGLASERWESWLILIYQALQGDQAVLDFLYDFNPLPIIGKIPKSELPRALAQGIVPLAIMGNDSAAAALKKVKTKNFGGDLSISSDVILALSTMAEFGDTRALDALAAMAESNPLAVSHLYYLGQHGNKIALNQLGQIDPIRFLAAAPSDYLAFYALVELARSDNRRAQQYLAGHIRAFPNSRFTIQSMNGDAWRHPKVQGMLRELETLCTIILADFSKASPEIRQQFLAKLWKNWLALSKARRRSYFLNSNPDAYSAFPIDFIIESARSKGWKPVPELQKK